MVSSRLYQPVATPAWNSSRRFDGVADRLEMSKAIITGTPCTIMSWFNADILPTVKANEMFLLVLLRILLIL